MMRNAFGIYGTVGGCVVGYVLCVLLRSESGFRQCLPVVLRMHILSASCRDVYRESSGEVLPKFCLGSG